MICYTYIRTLISSTASKIRFYTYTPSGRINLMIDQPEKVNAPLITRCHHKFVTLSYGMPYSFLVFSYVQSKIQIAWVVRIVWDTSLTLRSFLLLYRDAVQIQPNSSMALMHIRGGSVRASFSFSGSLDSRGPPLKTLSGKRLKRFEFQSISIHKNGSFPHLVIAAPRNSIMYETQFGTA